MEEYLKSLEQRTTAEVAVVTVPDMDGYAGPEEYANDLFTAWKIGKKGQDNGVLILLAMKEKKVRIEVGYGLEGAITDGASRYDNPAGDGAVLPAGPLRRRATRQASRR